jgi:uncharacterized repeat protein (TIGR03803 family)
VLHSFGGANGGGGVFPIAGLTNVNGVLYGTTEGSGSKTHGTVFKITTSGTETVLHAFAGENDGVYPYAGLTNLNGVLYGTTEVGGANECGKTRCGTVYKITTSGTESVLYNFAGGTDGASPGRGDLTSVDGVLYGTTPAGGGACSEEYYGCGTVFSITTSGVESVLHSFAGGSDGSVPMAGLTAVNGVLYGTTNAGGAYGKGTVFAITTSGAESVLYSFADGSDGAFPQAGLTNVNGVLYGTTTEGGTGFSGFGGGTVFSITTSGAESVLYRFAGGSDGVIPYAGLTNVKGVLYGTTWDGGADHDGTVFMITTSGAESVIYSFAGGSDGALPHAGLTNVNGVLYGTSSSGGANNKGTVFSLSL